MAASFVRWLESYEFGTQLLILALIFDPVGAVLGYLAHPLMGVTMFMGIAIGMVAAGQVLALWIVRHTRQESGSDTTGA